MSLAVMPDTISCAHGGLKRSCYTCELEASCAAHVAREKELEEGQSYYRNRLNEEKGINKILESRLALLEKVAEAVINNPDHGYEKGLWITRDRIDALRAALEAAKEGTC